MSTIETYFADVDGLRLTARHNYSGWSASVYNTDRSKFLWKSSSTLLPAEDSEDGAKTAALDMAAHHLRRQPAELNVQWHRHQGD